MVPCIAVSQETDPCDPAGSFGDIRGTLEVRESNDPDTATTLEAAGPASTDSASVDSDVGEPDLDSSNLDSSNLECADALSGPALDVSQAFGTVILQWPDFAGNDYGYQIFRNGVPYASTAAGTTYYNDRMAIDGETYQYAVWPVVAEPDVTEYPIPTVVVPVEVSAWSNLDPEDAIRVADAETIVAALAGVAPAQRDRVMAILTGTVQASDALNTDNAEAEDTANAEVGATGVFGLTEGTRLSPLVMLEAVITARDVTSRGAATGLVNTFLKEQDAPRRLDGGFEDPTDDPSRNDQQRLAAAAFDEIQSELSSVEFGDFEDAALRATLAARIVQVLDNWRNQGLRRTFASHGSPVVSKSEDESAEQGPTSRSNDGESLTVIGTAEEPDESIDQDGADPNATGGRYGLIDLTVEPGEGFELLPLNQPIPSSEGDQIDLGVEPGEGIPTLPTQ